MDEWPARYAETGADGTVRCHLCRFFCRIAPGRRGHCGVRENRQGTLVSLVYGRVVAEQVDPIEKKPLYHVLPGSLSYSIATIGCNFRCRHCQNHHIAHPPYPASALQGPRLPPATVVERALRSGCRSIAYTYTEPTIAWEYVMDVAALAHERGLLNLLVTNGYVAEAPLRDAVGLIDAANVDLKGFTEDFYRRVAGARLAPVLESLRLYRELGIWIEVTTLVIPGENDDPAELEHLAGFIVDELGPEVPWHLSAFHPAHQMRDHPPTPLATLQRAQEIGHDRGLRHIYLGNVRTAEGRDSHCAGCGALLVSRARYQGEPVGLAKGACVHCGRVFSGLLPHSAGSSES